MENVIFNVLSSLQCCYTLLKKNLKYDNICLWDHKS